MRDNIKDSAYPHKCPYCNLSARRNRNSLICSNVKCKSWKSIRILSAKLDRSKIIEEHGLTSDDPITITCPKCNDTNCDAERLAAPAAATWAGRFAYCYNCIYWFPYIYIKDRWYYSKIPHYTYSTKYIGDPNYWEWNTEIKKLI